MGHQKASDPPGPARSRFHTVGTAVFAVLAVVVIGAASFFSIRSASGGTDVRSNLSLIAPAAAGGGWDTFQRELQQTLRTNGIVNNVQVVNVPGAGGTIGIGVLAQQPEANNLMVGGSGHITAQVQFGTPPGSRTSPRWPRS